VFLSRNNSSVPCYVRPIHGCHYLHQHSNTVKSTPSNVYLQIGPKMGAYCSNRRTSVLSWLGMRYICTKDYCRYIGNMRYSSHYRIIQYSVRTTNLYIHQRHVYNLKETKGLLKHTCCLVQATKLLTQKFSLNLYIYLEGHILKILLVHFHHLSRLTTL